MKLAVLGGGGVRAPIFVASVVRRADRLGLDEVCLMDTDPEKLHLFGTLAAAVAREVGSGLSVTLTEDARTAVEDAGYVVTTIRVGGDRGRVADERIALEHGVLGQETTGAGGFAMALRSVPVVLDYARIVQEVSPEAWILNFTNPAGLVTQALRDRGFDRTIGICDGANEAQHAVADWLGADLGRLEAQVFGLNHLSWARRVVLDGEDALAPLLQDDRFLAETAQNVFPAELVRETAMWINPYLYYWYFRDDAIAAALGRTRGEEIVALTDDLLARLRSLDIERETPEAVRAFSAYERARVSTYMKEAHGTNAQAPQTDAADADGSDLGDVADLFPAHGEGYAGVALDIMEAMENDRPLRTAANVPNEGSIEQLRDEDVVEVSVVVERDSITPVPIGAMPEHQELLVRTVKLYEREAVGAILERSRSRALRALLLHPLVATYPRADALVEAYLSAHAPYVGKWRD